MTEGARRFAWTAALALLIGPGFLIPTPAHADVPPFDHIILIMMENRSLGQIVGNPDAPFLNGLAVDNPVAMNHFGITHPSLPNYMAVTGGDTFFTDNCAIAPPGCTTSALSIVDRLEASGRTWKAYMEDLPASPCFVGDSYPYVEKHNPFIHFDNIRNDPARCSNIVPYSQLAADLDALPDYVWITPNMCNDMHDCEIQAGDAWLSTEVPRIQNSPSCTAPQTCLIIITFDEGNDELDPPEDNHIFTMFVRPGPRAPDSETPYDHYSLLRTIEDVWGLAPLTENDAAATPMRDMLEDGDPFAERLLEGIGATNPPAVTQLFLSGNLRIHSPRSASPRDSTRAVPR